MAKKNYIAMMAIDSTKDGDRHEYQPGDPLTVDEADEARLLNAGAIREPSESEEALIEKRQAALDRTNAKVKKQVEPAKPNGPGGASGEAKGDEGNSSVASDTDTVGAAADAQKTDPEAEKEDEGEVKPKAKSKAKAKDDLA